MTKIYLKMITDATISPAALAGVVSYVVTNGWQ